MLDNDNVALGQPFFSLFFASQVSAVRWFTHFVPFVFLEYPPCTLVVGRTLFLFLVLDCVPGIKNPVKSVKFSQVPEAAVNL